MMSRLSSVVKRHPIVTFFVLAYALTWPVIPLVSVSPLLGIPARRGPALAAIIVTSLADGRSGLMDLLSRLVRWRVGRDLDVVIQHLVHGLGIRVGGTGRAKKRPRCHSPRPRYRSWVYLTQIRP